MNDLQIFENSEFGSVRTITVDGEPYFVGIDVADKLEYQNGSRDINAHVDECDRKIISLFDGKQNRKTTIINESGFYSLVFQSKMKKAKQFKHWVTSEVLPSIRKNGGYIAGQENMTDDELMAKALMVAQNKIAEKDKQIERMKPKEIFADAVSASETSILVGDLAKLISQNGYKIGQKRLFEWLRTNNFLIKSGSSRNMPQQRFVEQGLFEIKESNIQNPDGSVRITRTTKVTGKGQIYFVNKFMNSEVTAWQRTDTA